MHLNGHALVNRVRELRASFEAEFAAVMPLTAGRETEVFALILADDGVGDLTPAMEALRAELGLPKPVIPSARELGRLSRRLYTARPSDTAPAQMAGG